jgi:outer membrane protein assembly factor BamE (lipoprotein component of BamABCDE complex)
MRRIGGMKATRRIGTGAVLAFALLAGGCSAIEYKRGYLAEDVLMQAVQPGIDNRDSVERTLGRPTFTSHFGDNTWYYVSSTTRRAPFNSPKIKEHSVYAVNFDPSGSVISIDHSGMEQVAKIDADGDKTPTLGRERSFLEDLFGNIGAVGAGAPAAAGG